MDQSRLFKQIVQTVDEFTNKIKATHGRFEDIQYRAHRLETWFKNRTSTRAVPPDRIFPDDLKLLRRDVKRIIQDFAYLPLWLAKIERYTRPQPELTDLAVKLTRSASQFQQVVLTLLAPIQIAHNHLKVAEWKIDAWFLAQEIEAWAKETVAVPLRCHNILLKINPMDRTPLPPGTEGVELPEPPPPAPGEEENLLMPERPPLPGAPGEEKPPEAAP
ncbi:MAG: hypothetical protein HY926_05120 [Elusimicrobia bacterium]|nr:hypothetical protein [Elusimicrobiota bacterium]